MYGNHPSPLAYLGMAIIAISGLCALVSEFILLHMQSLLVQVYGPTESTVLEHVPSDTETSPLLGNDRSVE